MLKKKRLLNPKTREKHQHRWKNMTTDLITLNTNGQIAAVKRQNVSYMLPSYDKKVKTIYDKGNTEHL